MFAVEVDGANDENSFCKDGYVIKILTVNEIKSAEEQEKRRQRFQRDIKPTNYIHLAVSISRLGNLAMNMHIDKEKSMENAKSGNS